MAAKYTYNGPVDCTKEPNIDSIKGKTVIVTGGSRGIGAVYTKMLAEAGAYVMIGDLDTDGGEALASGLPKGHVWVSHCDVVNWDDQAKLFAETVRRSPSGRVDVVVANAGIATTDGVFIDDSAQDEPTKPSVKMLDINLTGCMYTAKLALYYFRRRYTQDISAGGKGRDTSLILQASVAGYLPSPGSVLYGASKFGLRSAMASLRHTCPSHRTRVNLIAPWFIKTDIIPDQIFDLVSSKGIAWSSIDDCGRALLHLVSDVNINGRAFAVVPRKWAPLGYRDVDQDDFKEAEPLKEWQDLLLSLGSELSVLD